MAKSNDTIEIINKSINTQTRLSLKIKHGLGNSIEVDFDPYIYGDDTMQYRFLWGYLVHNRLTYKFRVADIVSAKLTEDKFKIIDYAWYYYSLEEEFWNIAPDFETMNNIYTGSHIGGPL